jgi:hypothetical protein
MGRKSRVGRKGRKKEPATLPVLRDMRNLLRDQAVHQTSFVRDVQLMKLARNRVCSFVLEADYATIVSAPASTTYGAFAAILGNFVGYTELTSVFDQYRIMQMRMTFIPVVPMGNANAYGVLLYTAFDYDDVSPPIAVTDLEQYDTCLVIQAGTFFERICNPRVAYAAYGGGTFTSYANQRAGWIDAASSSVQHYGIKYAITANGSGLSVNLYTLKMQIFVQFRSQR